MSRTCNSHTRLIQALAVAALLVIASHSFATPLAGDPVLLAQPDGDLFVARPGGDEFFNWVSADGFLIARDARGWWCYATVQRGRLVASRAQFGRHAPPAGAALLDDVAALAAAIEYPRATYAPAPHELTRSVNRPVLVVLVEFTDRTFSTSDAYWQSLFFGTTGKTVRTYYNEVSAGNLDLVPAAETFGTVNDGIVRVQLNYAHPNPDNQILDANRWITHDALNAANTYMNWPALDTDSDTYLEPSECHIVTVVAGHEAGRGPGYNPAVIGHRWALGFTSPPANGGQFVPAPQLQGVTLCDYVAWAGYCQLGELHYNYPGTLGVPCHELGHDMGLPDLYDPTLASNGIGGHGVMGYGGWGQAPGDANLGETPVHFCAWSKVQLGFVTPIVATGNQDYSLYAAGLASYNVIRVNSAYPNEYFLLENRQPQHAQVQSFDDGLARWFSITSGGLGGGLAIWHIDDSIADNSNVAHKRVDLEEANEGLLGYSELDYRPPYPQDPTPYQGNRHHYYYAGHLSLWGDATTPSSRLYNGQATNINVSAVSPAGPVMKCYVATALQPVLEWCTFFGGSSTDEATGLVVDANNGIHVVGSTYSADFPTTAGAYQTQLYCSFDAFVAKFDTAGNLIYSTLFGCNTSGQAIAADSAGCAYLTGYVGGGITTTPGAYDTTMNGVDAFVTKFAANGGSLLYSTYLGGAAAPGEDRALGIAVDGSGRASVTGYTFCSDFPRTTGPTFTGGPVDAFVTKLNATGTGLAFSRLLPGSAWEDGQAVAATAAGDTFVTGATQSSNFPTTPGAFDRVFGWNEAFVARLDNSGNLSYATFLAGSGGAFGYGIAVDASGNAYVTGNASYNFPVTSGVLAAYFSGGNGDAFVTRLNPTGSALVYSTYLGGPQNDYGYAITLDSNQRPCVAGETQSALYFPLANPLFAHAGQEDAFMSILAADASSAAFSSYFGGNASDTATGIGVDSTNAVYFAGRTTSADFPATANAFDIDLSGPSDAYVAKVSIQQATTSLVVAAPDGGEVWRIGRTVTLSWSSSNAGANVRIEISRSGLAGPWTDLFATTANDGQEAWVVTGPAAIDCRVRITDLNNALLSDVSNTLFAIATAGDLDGDADVDINDFDSLSACMTGPDNPIPPPPVGGTDCHNADLDDDGDVDLTDWAQFQVAYTG